MNEMDHRRGRSGTPPPHNIIITDKIVVPLKQQSVEGIWLPLLVIQSG